MIRLGSRGWELSRGARCPECTPHPGLRDTFLASSWLRQFKTDPAVLSQIRHLVLETNTWWPLGNTSNDQVIECMARLLAAGEWHAHAPSLPKTDAAAPGENSGEVDLAEIVSYLPAMADAPPPPEPPQEQGMLPVNADEAAIAASMKLASQLGIPFCEECARAALKRSREAASA